ncbi:hypothetical protein GCM10022222_42430 [Amycolatopsis ultiminotia]|uniref:Uncharacterized protein n=1 Tax=Amycolatopsis ultiminotia TaxID=543629 RepID=A0ABP6WNM9_9PSEU
MRNAHPTRRELEIRFGGLDEALDLAEVLAEQSEFLPVLVEVGPEGEDLAEYAELLADIDGELAAHEAAQVPVGVDAGGWAGAVDLFDRNWLVGGVPGRGKNVVHLAVVLDVEAESEAA